MYEDLELILMEELELEGVREKEKDGEDIDMVGLSGAEAS